MHTILKLDSKASGLLRPETHARLARVPAGPNGDLLLPANVRPVIEQALLQVELALALDRHGQLATLNEAKRLLGIEQPQAQPSWLNNLYRVRGI